MELFCCPPMLTRSIESDQVKIIDEDSMIQDMMEISQSSQQEETHEENNFPAQRDFLFRRLSCLRDRRLNDL
jgi:hypothetical protein